MIPLQCWRKTAIKLEFYVQYKVFIKYKSEINKFPDKKRWKNVSRKSAIKKNIQEFHSKKKKHTHTHTNSILQENVNSKKRENIQSIAGTYK